MFMLEVGVLSSITKASRKPGEFVVVRTIGPNSVQKLEVNKTQGEPQDQSSSPPSHSNTESKPSQISQDKIMDTLMILCKRT